jgi:hypothetical protein
MSNKEKAPKTPKEPKAPKAPKSKKNFFDRAWDFIGEVGRKPWFRICEIVLATLLVILLIFYGAAMLFAEKSGFTVAISDDKEDKAAISLSESADFSSPTVRLDAGGIAEMTNISVLDLPESFESEGGRHNGANYLAYTFYLKNSGTEAADIRSELNIKSALYGAEDAIRVRVYRNGNDTTYAKLAKNGEPEYNTTPFAENRKVFSVVEEDVDPEEIIKYTIVVWFDGDDPECVDDIKGGQVKMSMTFSLDDAET